MKYECSGKIFKQFIGLRFKSFSIEIQNDKDKNIRINVKVLKNIFKYKRL